MNCSPIDLPLVLGVRRRPPASPGTRSAAFTWTSGTRKCRPNVSSTCAGSPARHQPGVDEHARELICPIGRCTSSAATAESTPPDSAQRARASPTWWRIRSTARSITFAGVQSGQQAARVVQEPLQHVHAARACGPPRDGTARAYSPRAGSSIAATGIASVRAVTAKPGGRPDDRVGVAHPHGLARLAGRRAARPGASRPPASVRPYSRDARCGSTSPPSAWAMTWCP